MNGSGTRGKTNRLIMEKSPYLLRHARNPVDWHPWSDEAFDRARMEDKPVFISSGYSACHWCHVMEEESYNDHEVAGILNEAFIPVKVDREERPDVDSICVAASELLTGTAGWPLNILMTPDKKPFFAATYIPKESLYGRPGIIELLRGMKDLWIRRRGDVIKSADKVSSMLRKGAGDLSPGMLPGAITISAAYGELTENFDAVHGGFGQAPKFPVPHNVTFLLRYWMRTGNSAALKMAETTLTSMRLGGIYDHVGFGFHRYSTDRAWRVPHFEKMLYDQALLADAYIEAYQATRKEFYARTAREILSYVLRDMTSPGGGFYSAEDADSEGVEGSFYLWGEKEIIEAAGGLADFAIKAFNVRREGNLSVEVGWLAGEAEGGARRGNNILYLAKPPASLAMESGVSTEEFERRLEAIRRKLFSYRQGRARPFRDDKILTDWNGLTIASLAKAGAVFEEGLFLDAASSAADFILRNLLVENRLLHCWRAGEAGWQTGEAAVEGNLNDYAFFIHGLIELYEATFEEVYLERALELNGVMTKRFWDAGPGGFFFTAESEGLSALPFRQKESMDGALPSGNSVAVMNCLRLSAITGDSVPAQMAEAAVRIFSGNLCRYPAGHTRFLSAVDFRLGPSYHVVVAGDSTKDSTRRVLAALRAEFIPHTTVVLKPEDKDIPDSRPRLSSLKRIVRGIEAFKSIDNKTAVYVCAEGACKEPVTIEAGVPANELIKLLGAARP
ncbi:MAG: thioredoxin domain-containing protein [Deltaproteobacteria bacterium]|nr:thioredoxin domain-containing protein [Deltaproteobacteria bacterium]